MAANVIWKPQPAQARFLRRPEYEALYGGAAGGGKSEALVMEAVRQVHIPHRSEEHTSELQSPA